MVLATSLATQRPHEMANTILDPWLLPQQGLAPSSPRPQGSKMVLATSLATQRPHEMANTVLDPWLVPQQGLAPASQGPRGLK
jgi:hypothetical protein